MKFKLEETKSHGSAVPWRWSNHYLNTSRFTDKVITCFRINAVHTSAVFIIVLWRSTSKGREDGQRVARELGSGGEAFRNSLMCFWRLSAP